MTSHGPTLIYDKSTLQGLTEKEAHWLHRHFHCIITPTIYMEVLADLKKEPRSGKSAEEEVATIVKKIPSYAFTPSMFYRDLLMEDLMAGPLEMAGRPYMGGGKKVRHPDGSYGVFYDERPEAKAFRLWSERKFDEMARLSAKEWRDALSRLDLEHRKKSFSWMKMHLEGLRSAEEILEYIEKALNLDPYRMLLNALEFFQVPERHHDEILNRWIRGGGKNLPQHIPYVCHVLKIDLFFTFLLVKDLISDNRPSHHVDFTYFYYLPFCIIFSSDDKLHKKYAPMLLNSKQKFIEKSLLKNGLAELVTYYAELSQDTLNMGYARYAKYPPLDKPLIISNIYDECCGYDWRSYAEEPEMPRDAEEDKKILEKIKAWQELFNQQHGK